MYKLLPSLREIVLVAHAGQQVDVVRREGAQWVGASYGPGKSVPLTSIDAALDVTEIYRDPLATSG